MPNGQQLGQGLGRQPEEVNPFMALLQESGGESPFGTIQNDDPRTVTQPYNVQPTDAPQGGVSQVNAQANAAVPGGTLPVDPLTQQLEQGENPSSSKDLLVAIKALENIVTASTDKQQITTIRAILALLSRMMGDDQNNLSRII